MKPFLRIVTAMFSLAVMIGASTGCSRDSNDTDMTSAAGTSDTDTSTTADARASLDASPNRDGSAADLASNDISSSGSGLSSGSSGASAANDSSGGSGTSDKQGASSVGAAIDDAAVTAKVKAALMADSDLKSLNISVNTHNNAVTLSGTADNQTQIDRAAETARGIDGVKEIQNKISIRR